MCKVLRNLQKLFHDRSGVAAMEMILSVPLLLAVLLGGVEVTRYILVAQKLEKVAVTLSDVATQSESLTNAQLDQIIFAAGQVMQPYPFEDDGFVVISSVTRTGTSNPVVNWQYTGGGSWTQVSRVGVTGMSANMPAGFTMDNQENVIVSEVFYNFRPIFGTHIFNASFMIYKTGYFRPRLGSLTTLGKLELNQPGAVL